MRNANGPGLAMPGIIDHVALIWVATIMAYAIIATTLIAMRWLLRQIQDRKSDLPSQGERGLSF